jgi:hypothetical protein|tara:strand:+ start:431 stop:550 length:120 start_codon:yes stop_codon:yes gene_type:complete
MINRALPEILRPMALRGRIRGKLPGRRAASRLAIATNRA